MIGLSSDWHLLSEKQPSNDVPLLVICPLFPMPINCVFQHGEPYQVILGGNKKTINVSFKHIKHTIYAWRSALGVKVLKDDEDKTSVGLLVEGSLGRFTPEE